MSRSGNFRGDNRWTDGQRNQLLYPCACARGNKMYIGHKNSQRLSRACTLASYTLVLDLVLEAIGVNLDVHLVLICKPGVPSDVEMHICIRWNTN